METGARKEVLVTSRLENVFGEKKQVRIALGDDGFTKAFAFFDIDGTLANLTFVHGAAIRKLFPEADRNEIADVYLKGFRLGTSFREFDRMHGIYREGHEAWRDPETYRRERLIPAMGEVDTPGTQAHDRARDYARRYSECAAEAAREIYMQSRELFEESKARPIFRLAAIYQKLGIPMTGVTANGRAFVVAVAKYIGLCDFFLDIATDEVTEGGGKEIAIEYLLGKFEEEGLLVSRDRLIIVGDSLRGDIGSGTRLKNRHPRIAGVLVLENRAALEAIRSDVDQDAELQKIVRQIRTRIMFAEDLDGPGVGALLGV